LILQSSFQDHEQVHYSLLNFNPFLPTGDHLSGFAQNSFEKWQVAAWRFSKEFVQSEVYQTLGAKLCLAVFKRVFPNSKTFSVKQLRTYCSGHLPGILPV
jgi:hypothetical protein